MMIGRDLGRVAVLGLVICLLLIPGNVSGQAQITFKVKMPGIIAYELNLPTLVALANGYFLEQGIELTDFVIASGGTLRAAMIAKEFDFGLFAFAHIPIARNAGSPWKAILATHDREIFNLVVRTELRDKVRTVADLKGMKVGFTTPGAGAWYMGSVYLKQSGLDPQKDVQYLPLGGDLGVIYVALKTGRIDAFPTWEPLTTRVIEEGIAYPLTRIWEPQEHRRWLGSDRASAMLLVTREDVIKLRPGILRRMVNAHKKGLNFIRTHNSGEIADAVMRHPKTAEFFTGLDRALVVKIFDRIKPGFGTGCLSRSAFDVEMKLAVEYELVKQAIRFEEFADTRFAGECP